MELVYSTSVSQSFTPSVSHSFQVSTIHSYFNKSTTSYTMSNSVLSLMLGISALILVFPVNMIPVQSDNNSKSSSMTTTAPNLSLNPMLHQLVGAKQTVQLLLLQHVQLSY